MPKRLEPNPLLRPAYDRILEQARQIVESGKRERVHARLEPMLTGPDGAMPIIPVFWNSWVVLRKPYVRGWEPNALDHFDLTQVAIEEH